MLHKKHKYHTIQNFSLSLLGVLAIIIFIFTPLASATPNFFKCDSAPLDHVSIFSVPLVFNNESFDCATGITDTDTYATSGPGVVCPPGVPMISSDAGMTPNYCLVDQNNVTVNGNPVNGQSNNADCKDEDLSKNCGIVRYLRVFINALSRLVGVVVVIMIIVGGIQYSSAGSDPQKIASAKSKITNALLALLVYIFMYAFLQWVVPGGIF